MICTHSREYSEGLSGINPRFEGQVVNVKVNAARPLTLRVDSIQSCEERRLVNDRVGEAVLDRALPNMNFAAARLFDYVSCFSVTKKSVSPLRRNASVCPPFEEVLQYGLSSCPRSTSWLVSPL